MPPVIVLVRPQLGENIGKAARAMLNFGLTELRLVTPRDGWPNPSAGPAASGADLVLERATVFDSTAAAVADCGHVFATTVRKRGVTKPVLTPEQAADAMHRENGRCAILFGAERSGLETEDVALARTIITVPINPEPSAIPIPSKATSTVPKGAKPVKFFTMLVRMKSNPSFEKRLFTPTLSFVPGCTTVTPPIFTNHEMIIINKASNRNNVAGSGSAFPVLSITASDRLVNDLRFGGEGISLIRKN